MTTVWRIFFIFIALAFVGALSAWIAGQPGWLTFTFLDKQIETTMPVALSTLVLVVLGAIIFDRLLRQIFSGPRRALEALAKSRRRRGEEALTQGLVAVAAGDVALARREAKRSSRLLKRAPLSLLLAAQTEAMTGNNEAAARHYAAMLDDPHTELLGRRGLFEMALKRNDFENALAQARRALDLHASAPWVLNAVFVLETRQGNWQAASAIIDHALDVRLIAPAQAKRRRAVLFTAWALQLSQGQGIEDAASVSVLALREREALGKSLEALALEPSLVPAAVLAAALLYKDGHLSRAEGIIEKAWSTNPHPDLADAYDDLAAQEPARVRGQRLDHLVTLNPTHVESRLIAAKNALVRHEFEAAQLILTALSASVLTARILALLAELARLQDGNELKARDFMARALHAPREGEWTCQRCGEVALTWAALCPACGEFDGLMWRAPHAQEGALSLLSISPEKHGFAVAQPRQGQGVLAREVLGQPSTNTDTGWLTPEMAVRTSSKETWIDEAWRKNRRREASLRSALESPDFFAHQPDDPGPEAGFSDDDFFQSLEADAAEEADSALGHDTLYQKDSSRD